MLWLTFPTYALYAQDSIKVYFHSADRLVWGFYNDRVKVNNMEETTEGGNICSQLCFVGSYEPTNLEDSLQFASAFCSYDTWMLTSLGEYIEFDLQDTLMYCFPLMNGLWTFFYYYDPGELMVRGHFINGLKEGYWEQYTDEGLLMSKGEYKKGKRDGNWFIVNEYGMSSEEGHYKNGKRDGKWEFYGAGYADKDYLYCSGTYTDGIQTGIWKYYYENGKLESSGKFNKYKMSVGEWKYYNEDGSLKEIKDWGNVDFEDYGY